MIDLVGLRFSYGLRLAEGSLMGTKPMIHETTIRSTFGVHVPYMHDRYSFSSFSDILGREI